MKEFFNRLFTERKYRNVAIICGILAILIIIGGFAAANYKKHPANNFASATPVKTATPEPKTICLLDGQAYSQDKATRHPLAVSVENHPDARPQSGLDKASIVYEAITEGGITRFLAVYGPNDASEIGPIRSARLFFMDWVKEYDAFFAHDGGNEDALNSISKYQIKNLQRDTSHFHKDSKGRNVATEHTLYSSTDDLYQFAKSLGFNTASSSYTALKFKADGPADPAGKGAEINFSSESYKVNWSFDPATNKYLRSLAGAPHKDRVTGEQLSAKNVIIQTVDRTFQPTGSYGSQNYVFHNVGSGNGYVLEDGKVIKATWKKSDLNARTIFYDETGAEITLNPGNTWYEIVPPEVTPTFQ